MCPRVRGRREHGIFHIGPAFADKTQNCSGKWDWVWAAGDGGGEEERVWVKSSSEGKWQKNSQWQGWTRRGLTCKWGRNVSLEWASPPLRHACRARAEMFLIIAKKRYVAITVCIEALFSCLYLQSACSLWRQKLGSLWFREFRLWLWKFILQLRRLSRAIWKRP